MSALSTGELGNRLAGHITDMVAILQHLPPEERDRARFALQALTGLFDDAIREAVSNANRADANAAFLMRMMREAEVQRDEALQHLARLRDSNAGALAEAMQWSVEDAQALIDLIVLDGGEMDPMAVESFRRALRQMVQQIWAT